MPSLISMLFILHAYMPNKNTQLECYIWRLSQRGAIYPPHLVWVSILSFSLLYAYFAVFPVIFFVCSFRFPLISCHFIVYSCACRCFPSFSLNVPFFLLHFLLFPLNCCLFPFISFQFHSIFLPVSLILIHFWISFPCFYKSFTFLSSSFLSFPFLIFPTCSFRFRYILLYFHLFSLYAPFTILFMVLSFSECSYFFLYIPLTVIGHGLQHSICGDFCSPCAAKF